MKTLISTLFMALLSLNLSAQVSLSSLDAQLAEHTNEQIYEQFYQALLSGDFITAKSYLAPDFTLVGMEADPLDANAYIKVWKGYHQNAHKLKMQGGIQALNTQLENMSGDWVGAWFEGTWTENASNKTFSAWAHQIAKFENAKISLIYHFENPLPYLMQSGYQLVPPSGDNQ